jgi:hypothetical protein
MPREKERQSRVSVSAQVRDRYDRADPHVSEIESQARTSSIIWASWSGEVGRLGVISAQSTGSFYFPFFFLFSYFISKIQFGSQIQMWVLGFHFKLNAQSESNMDANIL